MGDVLELNDFSTFEDKSFINSLDLVEVREVRKRIVDESENIKKYFDKNDDLRYIIIKILLEKDSHFDPYEDWDILTNVNTEIKQLYDYRDFTYDRIKNFELEKLKDLYRMIVKDQAVLSELYLKLEPIKNNLTATIMEKDKDFDIREEYIKYVDNCSEKDEDLEKILNQM